MQYAAHTDAPAITEHLAVLTRLCQMRVLNCSVSGCLLETNHQIQVGTVASIRVVLNGRELVDDVRIVRCQSIAGAGSVYHIGAQFLWARPPDATSLRAAMWQSSPAARLQHR